jgi:hypothetical protein
MPLSSKPDPVKLVPPAVTFGDQVVIEPDGLGFPVINYFDVAAIEKDDQVFPLPPF